MDWVSHNSRPLASHIELTTQFTRISTSANKLDFGSPMISKNVLAHANEFVPRVVNSSASASPNIFNSFSPIPASSTVRPVSRNIEDSNNISSHATPESVSPPVPINSSPVLHEKSGSSTTLSAYQENVGGTTYFYQFQTNTESCTSDTVVSSPISSDYNVYMAKQESFFMSDIRNDILNRNMLTLMQADPQQYPDLPQEVDSYHELCPLEPISNNSLHKTHIGYQSSMYKATHIKTGSHYCLRRIHGYRLQNTKCMTSVELWKKLTHSNIVQLKEVFTTKAFGDNSLIFVYDYHPGSDTLLNKHFSPDQVGYSDPFVNDSSTPRPYSYLKNIIVRHQQNNKLPEPLIWNYIIQLTSALRLIHSSALACRSFDPTKIIATSKNQLRLSCLGVMDVVLYETDTSVNHMALLQHYQQEDLTGLGKLVLALACKSTMAVQRENISTALDLVSRSYTPDLRNLITYLLSSQQRRSVSDLMPMIGARFYTQLDNLQSHVEALDHELSKEVQNGRLFRLMSKLASINERPEFNMDGAWAETGDRYMLKLFRDYVFHQVTEDGRPWLDMAHIIQCLNKLDTGVAEKLCLMSRDEQSILVVSYAELKHCLEQSFRELSSSAVVMDDISGVEDTL